MAWEYLQGEPITMTRHRHSIADSSYSLDVAAMVNDDEEKDALIGSPYLRGYDLEAADQAHTLQEELDRFSRSKLARKIQTLSSPVRTSQTVPQSDPSIEVSPNGQDGAVEEPAFARLAARRLAIDLQLSRTAIPTDDRLSIQSIMAEGLIVHDLPQEMASGAKAPELNYLHRKPKLQSRKEDTRMKENKAATMTALLAQWGIGTDPTGYAWPGITSHITGTRVVVEPKVAAPPPERLQPVRPFAPEMQTQPIFESRRRDPLMSSQSQGVDEMASTQMLPGPFANRNTVSFRRGGAKKRTIGF